MLVLPDKTLFYQDKLPDGKALSPEVKRRYQTIQDKLKAAGIATFDDEAVLRRLKDGGQDVFYRTDQHWTQAAADATADALAQRIRQDVKTLAGKPGTGLPLGSVFNERRYGDLAELFLRPSSASRPDARPSPCAARPRTRACWTMPRPRSTSPATAWCSPTSAFRKTVQRARPPGIRELEARQRRPLDHAAGIPGVAGVQAEQPQVLVWQMFEPTYAQGPDAKGLWDNASIMSADAWRGRMQAAIGK